VFFDDASPFAVGFARPFVGRIQTHFAAESADGVTAYKFPVRTDLDSRLRGNDDSEVTRNSKKTKPNEPDSRFYGNDGA
ncbi:hypothetical protein, partial [Neisseria meningitidis]|uniref:hypothetical protein n=1 Tax=Neisseria meningitidis TaxID=487 RepID=UPI001E4B6328